MNLEDLELCVRAGVHSAGFVVDFPVPVPWNLSPGEAAPLICKVPPFVSSCVVTGGSVDKILNLAKNTRPDIVQLHHQETLEDVKELSSQLACIGIKTIKALRIDGQGQCAFEIPDPIKAARALEETGISALVVDSFTTALPGGTGIMVNLSTFKRVRDNTNLPVILAGGLNPGNAFKVLEESRPQAIDVLTGVEERPGRKDPGKVRELMKIVRCDASSWY